MLVYQYVKVNLKLQTLVNRVCPCHNTFVGDDLVDLDTAGSSDDQLGLGVADALLDLQRSESSKDDLCGGNDKNNALWTMSTLGQVSIAA